ncbi:conserved protein of unknown function [Candidatus Filomicrobium marinum]|uniref:Molybdopterin-guanine dinucleotide biosynthesis protein A n=2 Tax=Filomicrobium TaxID=119044 RepID=A0A0D6JE74_9HYPH|nr:MULTISPECIES: DUF3305 domain-containing protein [Filomicrobium]MCV0367952.1 DUF3305 domain-containing protein [Filomicrobium sp.]CFX17372.1 conserved protein of unknown function [Candidatus Filomicrobium marinum]CPR18237.1 conserved protein of unknown function [Candidatus Filomicrobium marinum]SDO21902.1 Protein of unknown function [Filomicrobium insigne]
MSLAVSIPLGVVIARERISHPWQEYRWRPISVFLDAPSIDDWRELRRTDDVVHYHAATLPLELHRKETTAYCVNLANGEPSVYVVTREDPESGSEHPLDVHLVTASPFEAQPHASMGLDSVDCVAMPERLVFIIRDFIDKHHVEETFKKRRREPHLEPEKHLFGQEPIFALSERRAMMGKVNGAKGAKQGKTENE